MNTRERFLALMNFEPVDRLPMVEWAPWWPETVYRWFDEGLSREWETKPEELREHFGLDMWRQLWCNPRKATLPHPAYHGAGIMSSMEEYQALKEHLYPEPTTMWDMTQLSEWKRLHEAGEMMFWFTLDGYFWFARSLFGIERHLYAFYEQPDVMHAINQDLADWSIKVVDALCEHMSPDMMTFAEDMSYNNGPMISEALFEEYMAPYYNQVVPKLKEYGILSVVDTDGEIGQLIPWFLDVGVDGFLPLERQAGCDIAAYRRTFPDARFIGAFDKMTMPLGEAAMRAEFERLLPVMRQGGFVPSCDHQTPPGVSLDNYRAYLGLMKEYCVKAVTK